MGQIHRFRDLAAVSCGGTSGATRYVTAQTARQIAKALTAVARSIETESFTESSGLTFSFADMTQNDITLHNITAPCPRQRYTVKVWAHTLDGGPDRANLTFWETSHASAKAAARILAELINGKTARAAHLARAMNGLHAHYTVDDLALIPFRAKYGLVGAAH